MSLLFACTKDNNNILSTENCPEGLEFYDNRGGGSIELTIDGDKWASCRAYAELRDTIIPVLSLSTKSLNISGITYVGGPTTPERVKTFTIGIVKYNNTDIGEGIYEFQPSEENPLNVIMVVYSDIRYNSSPTSGIPTGYSNLLEGVAGDYVEIQSIKNGYVKGKIKAHLTEIDTEDMILIEGNFDVKLVE